MVGSIQWWRPGRVRDKCLQKACGGAYSCLCPVKYCTSALKDVPGLAAELLDWLSRVFFQDPGV